MLIVICHHHKGNFIPERLLADCEWDKTVRDVADGQFGDIEAIIQTSTGADVLPYIAGQVMDRWAEDDEPLTEWKRDFIQQHVRGVRAFGRKIIEAAE